MEVSLEILYVDIRAYNKKLGFFSAACILMRHYLVLLFHFFLQPRTKLLRQFHLFSNFCALLPSPLNTKSKPPPHPLFKVVLV